MTTAFIFSIFLGALVSGWHCALMCGGIAVAIESPVRITTSRRLAIEQLVMHLGRIGIYTILGAIAGFLGATIWQQSMLPVQRALFLLAALLLLLQAVLLFRGQAVNPSRFEAWVTAKTAKLWQWLTQMVVQHGKKTIAEFSWTGRLLAGAVWGLVPCGLIYSVLPYAFLAGNGASGALVMLAFGLGTLPNLLLISGFSARLAAVGHSQWTRYLAALLMAVTGLFGLYRALTLSDAMLRGGFCLTH